MAVSLPDLKAFLVATPFFGGLSDASLDLLVSMLAERRFDAGATVVAEGEPGRSMFIVHSGELAVNKLGDLGRVIRMADLGPGDFFGEMTLIEMQNRSASVVAAEPDRAVRAHGPEPLHVLQGRHPRVCDGDAEYQPRALPAAPPRRQSHCRAGRCCAQVECRDEVPALREVAPGHGAARHLGCTYDPMRPIGRIMTAGAMTAAPTAAPRAPRQAGSCHFLSHPIICQQPIKTSPMS